MKNNTKQIVNYGKIKRDLIKRDTDFDSRFTTKIVDSKTRYSRKLKHKNISGDEQ